MHTISEQVQVRTQYYDDLGEGGTRAKQGAVCIIL